MGRPKKPNLLPATTTQNPIAIETKDSREDQFIVNLFVYKSIKEAALASGYSKTYSEAQIHQKFKSKRFQDKIVQAYKDNCYADLSLIHKINHKALEAINSDLENGSGELLAKLKHVPRQYLEIVKLLSPEAGTQINMVHIDSLQAIVSSKLNGKSDPTGSSAE